MPDIHAIGFALAPLLILLFAIEMASVEDRYAHGLPEKAMSRRVALYVAKLPLGIVLPAVLGWPGFAAVLAADAASLLDAVFRVRTARKTPEPND